jgi:hypothetical protein
MQAGRQRGKQASKRGSRTEEKAKQTGGEEKRREEKTREEKRRKEKKREEKKREEKRESGGSILLIFCYTFPRVTAPAKGAEPRPLAFSMRAKLRDQARPA